MISVGNLEIAADAEMRLSPLRLVGHRITPRTADDVVRTAETGERRLQAGAGRLLRLQEDESVLVADDHRPESPHRPRARHPSGCPAHSPARRCFTSSLTEPASGKSRQNCVAESIDLPRIPGRRRAPASHRRRIHDSGARPCACGPWRPGSATVPSMPRCAADLVEARPRDLRIGSLCRRRSCPRSCRSTSSSSAPSGRPCRDGGATTGRSGSRAAASLAGPPEIEGDLPVPRIPFDGELVVAAPGLLADQPPHLPRRHVVVVAVELREMVTEFAGQPEAEPAEAERVVARRRVRPASFPPAG